MLKIVNPATEATLREIPQDPADAVGKKFERARAAQGIWGRVPLEERKTVVQAYRAAIVEKTDELASTLVLETGKPVRQAREEISSSTAHIDYYLRAIEECIGERYVFQYPERVEPGDVPRLREAIAYEALGTVAYLDTWTAPYEHAAQVIVPALLAGNTVLYKPSVQATLTGQVICELLHKAGVPADACIRVSGGVDTGRAVVAQPLSSCFFAGGVEAGTEVAAAAAARLVPAHLSLPGKEPVYVCEDVDVVAVAAAVAGGAFHNGGQGQRSVERVYVHRRIYDAFVDALQAVVQDFVLGDPCDAKTYVGPVARPEQLALLQDHADDALAQGGQLLCGGTRREAVGYFYEPTVIGAAHHGMRLMKEKIRGPMVGVMPVADDAEATALINDSDYGLTAAVYARDEHRARTILRNADAGTVYWNCCDRVSPRLPACGRKRSGTGIAIGSSGIMAFCRPKAWQLTAL